MTPAKTLLYGPTRSAKLLLLTVLPLCLLLLTNAARPAIGDSAIASSQAYRQRNTPEAIGRVAQKLAAMLNPGVRGMQPFDQAMRARNYTAALQAFKQLLLHRMRYINTNSGLFGAAWLPGPRNASAARRAAIFARADALLHGRMIINGKTTDIGAPGAVNWRKFSKGGMINGNVFPWHVAAFDPLISAYAFTGKPKYLRTWAAYADDWAINQTGGMARLKPELVGDIFTGGPYTLVSFARRGSDAMQHLGK